MQRTALAISFQQMKPAPGTLITNYCSQLLMELSLVPVPVASVVEKAVAVGEEVEASGRDRPIIPNCAPTVIGTCIPQTASLDLVTKAMMTTTKEIAEKPSRNVGSVESLGINRAAPSTKRGVKQNGNVKAYLKNGLTTSFFQWIRHSESTCYL